MARRPLVGDAYVRIHADSSAIDNELRREFSKASKRASKDGSKEFIAQMDKEIAAEAKRSLRKSNEALVRGIVGGPKEWDKQFKQSALPSVDAFANDVRKRLERIKSAAEKAGGGSNKSFKKFQQSLDELEAWAENAKVAQKFAETTAKIREQDKAYQSYSRNIDYASKRVQRAVRDQTDAFQTYAKNIDFSSTTKRLRRAITEQERAFRSYEGNIRFSARKIEKAILDQDRAFQSYTSNIKAGEERSRGAFRRLSASLKTASGDTEKFTRSFGKAFGRGSRNNFFNFIGVIAEGVAQIGVLFGKGGVSLTGGFFSSFKTLGKGAIDIAKGLATAIGGGGSEQLAGAFSDLNKNMKTLAADGFAALLSGAKAGGPALLAVGASISAIAFLLPPVIALAANLAGILIALTSTVAIGLAGALLVAAPAALALGAGIGTLVLALFELKNATDDEKKALKPLSDAWADLRKQFRKNVMGDFIKALGSFAPLMRTVITPALLKIGDVIVDVTKKFSKLFNSKEFRPFLDALSDSLPRIFGSLATAAGNFTAAILALFKPVLPYVEKAATAFENLTQNFLDWTMSAKGQSTIADFMKTAYDRATDLWDIIVLVGQALGSLFTLGDEGGGNTLIDTIKQKLTDLVTYLQDPNNADSIKQFFSDSVDTARSLWKAISNITTALAGIDWEQASQRANTAIEWIGAGISFITTLILLFNTYQTAMATAFTTIGNVFRAVYNTIIGPVFDNILGAFSAVARAFSGLYRALSYVPNMEFLGAVADALEGAASQADALGDKIRTLPDGDVSIYVGLNGPGAQILQQQRFKNRPRVGGPGMQLAAGGILTAPTFIRSNVLAGEAGREAVVPLDRPLALVDPSVRALAAFAQGRNSMGSGGLVGAGGTVIQSGAIQIVTPYANPELVAESVFDRFAANAR